MNNEYRPRFLFDITEEQQNRANNLLAFHGIRKAIFSIILDDVLDLIEERGEIVIGIILSGAARPKEILPILAKANKESSNG